MSQDIAAMLTGDQLEFLDMVRQWVAKAPELHPGYGAFGVTSVGLAFDDEPWGNLIPDANEGVWQLEILKGRP